MPPRLSIADRRGARRTAAAAYLLRMTESQQPDPPYGQHPEQ